MRGLICDDHVLGPKTEDKKGLQISVEGSDVSPIPRCITSPDDEPLSDYENFILRNYGLASILGLSTIFLRKESDF